MSQGDSWQSFDSQRFGSDMRAWLAVHGQSLRDLVVLGLPAKAATLSRLQRGMCEPHAGLFLAICGLMQLEPTAYYLNAEGADDGPAE